MLLLLSCLTPLAHLTLHADSVISPEVSCRSASSGSAEGVVCALLLWTSSLTLSAVVADDSAAAVAIQNLMILVLPLLA